MKLRSVFSTLLFAASYLPVAAAQTSTWKIDPVHSGVSFKIRHLGISNVRGTFSRPTGVIQLDEKDITKSTVEASIDTSTVSTNNADRDKHLKSPDFFDVEKYPAITFKSTAITNDNGHLMLTGNLTLNGVTRPVTLAVDGPAPPRKGANGTLTSGFAATGSIHRPDFNFGSKYGSPMLGDDVQFDIDIEMQKQ